MKILFYALSAVVLFACNNTKPEEKTSEISEVKGYQGENVGSRLDTFVSNFLSKQENIAENDLVLEKANFEFDKQFQQLLLSGLLDTVTFTSFGARKDAVDKKIQSTFSYGVTSKDSSYVVNVFVDVPLKEEMALKIKEFAHYKVTGDFSWPENKLMKGISGYTPHNIKIQKERNTINPRIFCFVFNIHNIKLNIKDFTEVPKNK